MTAVRHRYVGDALAYDFAIQLDGVNTPIPTATLEFGALAPDGTTVPGSAAWLSAPEDHVVRGSIAEGAITQEGAHTVQLKITDASLAEPVRGAVLVYVGKSI